MLPSIEIKKNKFVSGGELVLSGVQVTKNKHYYKNSGVRKMYKNSVCNFNNDRLWVSYLHYPKASKIQY